MSVVSADGVSITGADGERLNAHCDASASALRASVTLESAGGSRAGAPRKNADYRAGLTVVLERAATAGAQLLDAYLNAKTEAVQGAPMSERRVDITPFAYPVDFLRGDPQRLAPLLMQRQRGLVRASDATGSGNSERRLTLIFGWRALPQEVAPEGLVNALVKGSAPSEWIRLDADRVSAQADEQQTLATPPAGRRGVVRQQVSTFGFVRDPQVIAWVLQRAAGSCELCGEPAPFVRRDGAPFLEVHHVRPLADGGSDRVTNAAALCPNCHRRCHLAKDAVAANALLLKRVGELKPE